MTAAAVTVRRARLGPRWAAAPGREALQRWLSDIHLARHGLPAQAIVIVQRVQAPAAALHGAPADPLAAALRGALRPARERGPLAGNGAGAGAGVGGGTGAGAVWFADEAELLACLARDVMGGELRARWWWPLFFGCTPTPELALRRWVAAPQSVPWALAALDTLAPAGQDLDWLAEIGSGGRAELLAALARAFPVCAEVQRCVAEAAAPVLDKPGTVLPGVPTRSPASAQPARPNAARVLQALAEVLRHAPQQAASASFTTALLASAGQGGAPHPPQRGAETLGLQQAGAAQAPAPPRLETAGPRADPAPGPLRADEPSSSGRDVGLGSAQRQPSTPPPGGWLRGPVADAAVTAAAAAGMAPGAPVRGVPGLLPPYAMPQTARPRLAPSSAAAAEEPAALLPQSQSFETRFGGIVFLCNVALNLGLYGDFTQPLQPAVPVSPWRLLHTALGAAFGRAGRADALAHWLLLRDGGAAEPRLAGPWQLPGAALRAFDADERPWHGVVVSGVMELWHPAGFCLAHRLPRHELAPLLARLQRPRQAVVIHAVHAVHAVRAATPAPRLSLLLWPLLRARLRLGLGLGGPTSLRAAVALALPLPARVRVRSERVDLHFSLAALPLAVRMAGLDRDPGWLPAAGADIRFHFD